MATSADDYGLIRLGSRVRDVDWISDEAKAAFVSLYSEETANNITKLIEKHRMMFKNTADTGNFTQIQMLSPLGVITEFATFVRGIGYEPKWLGAEKKVPNYEVVYLIGKIIPELLINVINAVAENKDYADARTSVVLVDAIHNNIEKLAVSTDVLVKFYYRIRSSLSSRSSGIRMFNRSFNAVSNKVVALLAEAVGKKLVTENKCNTVGAALVMKDEDIDEKFKDCASFIKIMSDPYGSLNEENVKQISAYALPVIRQRFPFALPREYDRKLYTANTNIQRAARIASEWSAGTRSLRIKEVQTILDNVCEILTTDMPDQAKIAADVGMIASWSLLAGHPNDAFELMMSYSKRSSIKLFVMNQKDEVMNRVNDWCEKHNINVSVENVCVELV